MVNFTKKKMDAIKAKNAQDVYERDFGFYLLTRVLLIAAFPIIGAVAALGLGVFAAPALIPLAVFASNSDRMASFIERFENQPLKFFRDGMVVIGNFLNAISPLPSPAYSTEESQIGDAVNARNIQMVVVCILLSFTAAFFPPAIPVVIGIAALYMVCTVACRTADTAHSVENSKKELGKELGLGEKEQIENDSLLRKLVNEFDDKAGYDEAMLNNPETIKNCVKDIKNKATFSEKFQLSVDCKNLETMMREFRGTTLVFTNSEGQKIGIEEFMKEHNLVFGENAIPNPETVNDDDVAEFLTTTLQANFHLKKEVNEETKKLKKITILDPLENATNLKDSIAKKIEAASTPMGMDAPAMGKTETLPDTCRSYIERRNGSQISKIYDKLKNIRVWRSGEKAVRDKIKDPSSERTASPKITPPKQGAGKSGV